MSRRYRPRSGLDRIEKDLRNRAALRSDQWPPRALHCACVENRFNGCWAFPSSPPSQWRCPLSPHSKCNAPIWNPAGCALYHSVRSSLPTCLVRTGESGILDRIRFRFSHTRHRGCVPGSHPQQMPSNSPRIRISALCPSSTPTSLSPSRAGLKFPSLPLSCQHNLRTPSWRIHESCDGEWVRMCVPGSPSLPLVDCLKQMIHFSSTFSPPHTH